MSKLKVGDTVIYDGVAHKEYSLTFGKIYEVKGISKREYSSGSVGIYLVNDNGQKNIYPNCCFTKVDKPRKGINDINIDFIKLNIEERNIIIECIDKILNTKCSIDSEFKEMMIDKYDNTKKELKAFNDLLDIIGGK